ncbi:MAG: SRPBCC family protein, partial [Phycisphaerae bacterium]
PLWAGTAVLGAIVGTTLGQHDAWLVAAGMIAIIFLVPILIGAESLLNASQPEVAARTTVNISAPPQVVWNHVVEFPDIPPPKNWVFRTGVAYPIGASIEGRGAGAIRRCRFSTGDFVEPITTWDSPHLLAFDVSECPIPMKELSFYEHVHPPHLDGSFVSTSGQFKLRQLEDGRTELEGTTWYRHEMRPSWYWNLWTDFAIHTIHLRVLEHVKLHAESSYLHSELPPP